MKTERTSYHYWLYTKDETGKPYLIYGGLTEEAARQKGFEMLAGLDFDIKRLPTRNLQRASSLLKGGRLEKTHSLKKATERLGHNRSLKRQQNKGLNKKSSIQLPRW